MRWFSDISLKSLVNEIKIRLSTLTSTVTNTFKEVYKNLEMIEKDAKVGRYGICSTTGSETSKSVPCEGFELNEGAEITVRFTYKNSASNPTLNVNSTGSKPIFYNGAAVDNDILDASGTYLFRYNGTQYDLVGAVKLVKNLNGMDLTGSGTATDYVSNPSYYAIVNQEVTVEGYRLVTGAEVTVRFPYTITVDAPTLNVNGTGAKPIHYDGKTIPKNTIKSNRLYTFRYTGTYYELVGDFQQEGGGSSTSGNADTATKLQTARAINGMLFDGSSNVNNYYTCITSGSTQEKAITSVPNWSAEDGAEVCVKFTNDNTALNPSLTLVYKVSKGSIYYKGSPINASLLKSGIIYTFRYDKTNNRFDVVGELNDGKTPAGIHYINRSATTSTTGFSYSDFDESKILSKGDLCITSNKMLFQVTGLGSGPAVKYLCTL